MTQHQHLRAMNYAINRNTRKNYLDLNQPASQKKIKPRKNDIFKLVPQEGLKNGTEKTTNTVAGQQLHLRW